MVDHGLLPVFVFDGEHPILKDSVLEKRNEKRDEAKAALELAKNLGNQENNNYCTLLEMIVITEQTGIFIKSLNIASV